MGASRAPHARGGAALPHRRERTWLSPWGAPAGRPPPAPVPCGPAPDSVSGLGRRSKSLRARRGRGGRTGAAPGWRRGGSARAADVLATPHAALAANGPRLGRSDAHPCIPFRRAAEPPPPWRAALPPARAVRFGGTRVERLREYADVLACLPPARPCGPRGPRQVLREHTHGNGGGRQRQEGHAVHFFPQGLMPKWRLVPLFSRPQHTGRAAARAVLCPRTCPDPAHEKAHARARTHTHTHTEKERERERERERDSRYLRNPSVHERTRRSHRAGHAHAHAHAQACMARGLRTGLRSARSDKPRGHSRWHTIPKRPTFPLTSSASPQVPTQDCGCRVGVHARVLVCTRACSCVRARARVYVRVRACVLSV